MKPFDKVIHCLTLFGDHQKQHSEGKSSWRPLIRIEVKHKKYSVRLHSVEDEKSVAQQCQMVVIMVYFAQDNALLQLSEQLNHLKAQMPNVKPMVVGLFEKKDEPAAISETEFIAFAQQHKLSHFVHRSHETVMDDMYIVQKALAEYLTPERVRARSQAKQQYISQCKMWLLEVKRECIASDISAERLQEIRQLRSSLPNKVTSKEADITLLRAMFSATRRSPEEHILAFLDYVQHQPNATAAPTLLKVFLTEVLAEHPPQHHALAAYLAHEFKIKEFEPLNLIIANPTPDYLCYQRCEKKCELKMEFQEWEKYGQGTPTLNKAYTLLRHFVFLRAAGEIFSAQYLAFFNCVLGVIVPTADYCGSRVGLESLIRETYSDFRLFEYPQRHSRRGLGPFFYGVLQEPRRVGEPLKNTLMRYAYLNILHKNGYQPDNSELERETANCQQFEDMLNTGDEVADIQDYFESHSDSTYIPSDRYIEIMLNYLQVRFKDLPAYQFLVAIKDFPRFNATAVSCFRQIMVDMTENKNVNLSLIAVLAYCEPRGRAEQWDASTPEIQWTWKLEALFTAALVQPEQYLRSLQVALRLMLQFASQVLVQFLEQESHKPKAVALAAYIADVCGLPLLETLRPLVDLEKVLIQYKKIYAQTDLLQGFMTWRGSQTLPDSKRRCELIGHLGFLSEIGEVISPEMLGFFKSLLIVSQEDATQEFVGLRSLGITKLIRATHSDAEVYVATYGVSGMQPHFYSVLQEFKRPGETEEQTWDRYAMLIARNLNGVDLETRVDNRLATLLLAEQALSCGGQPNSVDHKSARAVLESTQYLVELIEEYPAAYLSALYRIFKVDNICGTIILGKYLQVIDAHKDVVVPSGMAAAMNIFASATCGPFELGFLLNTATQAELQLLFKIRSAATVPLFEMLENTELLSAQQTAVLLALIEVKQFSLALEDLAQEFSEREHDDDLTNQLAFLSNSLKRAEIHAYEQEYYGVLLSLIPNNGTTPLPSVFFDIIDHLQKRQFQLGEIQKLCDQQLVERKVRHDVEAFLKRGANPAAIPGCVAALVRNGADDRELALTILTYCRDHKMPLGFVKTDPENERLLIYMAKLPVAEVNLELFKVMVELGFPYDGSEFASDEVQNFAAVKIIVVDQARRIELAKHRQSVTVSPRSMFASGSDKDDLTEKTIAELSFS